MKKSLLTSAEAIALFEKAGLSEATFYRKVREEKVIDKVLPPGRSRGAHYPREQIEKIIRQEGNASVLEDEKEENKKETLQPIVDWIGVGDVLTSLQLDYRVYGPEVFLADLQYYADRVVKNPHVALAVFSSPTRERILAYISLLPLPEKTILEILSGKRHETKIRTDEIETYDREGAYTLLAESVVTDPEHSEQLNRLLHHLLQYWCEQYPKRYITKIYAQAESDAGDILIQKLFLAPREDLAPNAYVLNLTRPAASRFIRQFQECLKKKQEALNQQENSTEVTKQEV